jgi:hypothetical protein
MTAVKVTQENTLNGKDYNYLPNSMEQGDFKKLTGPKLVKKFPAIAQRFTTTFTRTCHLPLS